MNLSHSPCEKMKKNKPNQEYLKGDNKKRNKRKRGRVEHQEQD